MTAKMNSQEKQRIREEVWKTVEGLSDEQLNRRPDDNRWSLIQVIEHLRLMEQTITGGMARALADPEDRNKWIPKRKRCLGLRIAGPL
ncbi:DinB family protein [Paenibacillus aurantius]|uniref:DinB family protein n=1 Tax=Paenibacillus aurantius TaxID=2918900 RepID=A0AA96LII4_9BACL|nr:DinB family protein [Paenibacillus aurantius]WNQ13875.1 DinB family protein [Paenibacillus aurantius]